MGRDIQAIFSAVQPDMDMFRKEFDRLITSDVRMMNIILKYLFKKKGKQIRPLFVILSAGLFAKPNDQTHRAAALIELLHTATLVHDDVVDEADYRRGMFTVNALWKNKAAVLVGDYLLATGLLTALDNNYFQLLKFVSDATRKMSEGELWQIRHARGMNQNEESYLKIIEYKTAVLFGACFQCGAYTAGAENEDISKMYSVGLNAGIAFQIRDDILDFSSGHTGKKSFADLKEKKLTLPVIHALNNSSHSERIKFKGYIRQFKKKSERADLILHWLSEKGSLQYAEQKMKDYQDKAIQILDAFSDSEAKTRIRETILFLIQRNY
jgi:octaprenyl-diphosphate synthase